MKEYRTTFRLLNLMNKPPNKNKLPKTEKFGKTKGADQRLKDLKRAVLQILRQIDDLQSELQPNTQDLSKS